MCGFIGIFGSTVPADSGMIKNMSAVIGHRGPDLDKMSEYGDSVLAFRRLAIVDITEGAQPYNSDCGRYTAVFNGEIYNHLELRDELIACGVDFVGKSEIEVITKLYIKYGAAFLGKLRGMFAIVIIDHREHTMFAARDGFGIKPLYYSADRTRVVFGSELKAFKKCPYINFNDIDKASVQHYMTFQYVPEPKTVLKSVKQLAKGSYMICRMIDGGLQYETSTYFMPVPAPEPYTEYRVKKARLYAALENSVAYHMQSDVPVGTFLSGGIDSAAITALAAKISPGIKCFTVDFDMPEYSESDEARRIAERIGADHTVYHAPIDDFVEAFPKTVYHLDSPMSDPSCVAIYLACQEASKHVKTILSGEGSDELLGGYNQYQTVLSSQGISRLPSFIKSALHYFASLLPDGAKGKGYIMRGTEPVDKRYLTNAVALGERQKRAVFAGYDKNISPYDIVAPVYARTIGYSPLMKMQYCDIALLLPSDMLVKGDRLSMAHSLELRTPFIDREVYEAARALVDDDKLQGGATKYILRDACRELLGEENAMRNKLGYPVPVKVWLKNELYDWAKNIISEDRCPDYINAREALVILEAYRKGKTDNYRGIWNILTFITWYKQYILNTNDSQ